ncbi:MAG: hypothetical protein WAV32_03815 [Halobacteriota archaeon]
MNTTYRVRLIIAVAVALTVALAGIASASPPVPPPIQDSLIESTTSITAIGTVTSHQTFDWLYSDIPAGQYNSTNGDEDDDLADEERVAQIQYNRELAATRGVVDLENTFTFDSTTIPNLEATQKLGFMATNSTISSVGAVENGFMGIVTEGDDEPVSSGAAALCVWVQGVCIPPTNELVAVGSELKGVTLVSAETRTSVSTTEDAPRIHHDITAGGVAGIGMYTTEEGAPLWLAEGTVSAGMKVSTMEGRNCSAGTLGGYPRASTLTYDEMVTVSGMWNVKKDMTYTAQIPLAGLPTGYPLFSIAG